MGRIKTKPKVSSLVLTVVALIIGITCIFPFIFMISTSFKFNAYVFEFPVRLIPKPLNVANYPELFSGKYYFGRWYFNSVFAMFVTIVLKIPICGMAAYSLARLKYKGRNLIFILLMTTLMFPNDFKVIPQYVVFSALHLTNTVWSVTANMIFEFFLVFLLRQFFINIPMELTEAAKIDGYGHVAIFYKIILPLAKPALATMLIFTFTWQWNDFQSPFIFINDTKKQLLTVGIASFASLRASNYTLQMAGTTIGLVPAFLVFLALQKYFIEGLAAGAVKG
ncbi:MAG TPA: carbohydrate ABC transporter permease [Ruminiclostridium sp.]|nr:carbohydrate ABC transporter permease [Ruminiclostridium sp.]